MAMSAILGVFLFGAAGASFRFGHLAPSHSSMLLPLVAALLQSVALSDTLPSTGAQDPAWAADGRLALAIRGDLWVRAGAGTGAGAGTSAGWRRVTQGPAWDRQPTWS